MAHEWMNCIKRIFKKDKQQEVAHCLATTGVTSEAGKTSHTLKPANPMTRVLQPAYTRRLRPEPGEAAVPAGASPLLSWHGITDIGLMRPHNEDNFSCRAFEKWSLFVVADGMGGHDAGEVASNLAVETVCTRIEEQIHQNDDLLSLVEHVVQQANSAVKQEGENRGSNMGTTLSLALVAGNTAYIANVGDSRVYWIENGSITQITEDHSLVAKLTAAGKLTKEEARNHPQSNLLYRTIGTDAQVKVDTFRLELNKGGGLLLCTDGLWGEVDDKDIHRAFVREKDTRAAAEQLVRTANANGGKDNITAVVVKME